MRTVPACGKNVSRDVTVRTVTRNITVHTPPESGVANSNTLRDAQKRQKTPFRAVKLGIFVRCTRKHLAGRYHVNSNKKLTLF